MGRSFFKSSLLKNIAGIQSPAGDTPYQVGERQDQKSRHKVADAMQYIKIQSFPDPYEHHIEAHPVHYRLGRCVEHAEQQPVQRAN